MHNTQNKIPSRLLPVKDNAALLPLADHCEVDILSLLVDLIDGKRTYVDNDDNDDDESSPPPPSKKQKLEGFIMTVDELRCFRKYEEPLLFHN